VLISFEHTADRSQIPEFIDLRKEVFLLTISFLSTQSSHSAVFDVMHRLHALFSADEVRGIRKLIVEGKIIVDTFQLFSDAELVTTLQDELASQQGKVNYFYLSRILIPDHALNLFLYLISCLHRAVCFEIALYLSSHFSYSSAAFRKIAQGGGGGQGQGELWCPGDVWCWGVLCVCLH
jgi:hypothetical protein